MKRILILFVFILGCEGVDVEDLNSDVGDVNSDNPTQSAEKALFSMDFSPEETTQFNEWKNLYLSEEPILSSIDIKNIKISLDLADSGLGTEQGGQLYKGNLSFKFQSNGEDVIFDRASTGDSRNEIKYNYVYAYVTAAGEERYGWKSFFESKYGAFIIVLKDGMPNDSGRIVFSVSSGSLYYKHWGRRGNRSNGDNKGNRDDQEPPSNSLTPLGSNPKCWLTKPISGQFFSYEDSFDCRTWKLGFQDQDIGVEINRSLEPDDLYQNEYIEIVRKTISHNFHYSHYPPPPTSDIKTWVPSNQQTVISRLIQNKDKSYGEIYESLSGLYIGTDFKSLVAAIPIKLQGRELSSLGKSTIAGTYSRLLEQGREQLERWKTNQSSSEIKALQKELLSQDLERIGREYGDPYPSEEGYSQEKNSAELMIASPVDTWEIAYVKLGDFSKSNIKIVFDESSNVAGILNKSADSSRSPAAIARGKRDLSSVKKQKDSELFYKLLLIGLSLLCAVFIIRKKSGIK